MKYRVYEGGVAQSEKEHRVPFVNLGPYMLVEAESEADALAQYAELRAETLDTPDDEYDMAYCFRCGCDLGHGEGLDSELCPDCEDDEDEHPDF